ncbi:MAG: tetratricopeptide repeat protein [Fimbriiglobus sp.]|jgi:lipoprotein NlpI|nr:tetratricopeptide repeat protein [Fimbriiglobus sp.]
MRSLALALFATVSLLAADPPKADDKKAKLITEVEAKVKEVDESKASNAEKAKEYAAAGQAFLQLRQPGRAVEVFTKSIAADDNPAVKDRRGDAYLWAGQFAEAVADYDAFLKTNPRFAPEHWRRGIALYYAGKHADGVAQFEVHKTANPQDVENAAWHYLCNVKVVGKDKARKELIDVTRDRRVPMAEIQKLFAGTLKPEDVLAAGEKAQGAEKVSGQFYAHLYVGLWYEAEGDAAKAKEHLTTAVEKYEVPDYMWDVGNAHLKMLKAKK